MSSTLKQLHITSPCAKISDMEMDKNWGLLGHEWAVDLLRGHISGQRARHAYLITGPKGVGRRTLAIRLAQALNCSQPSAPAIPCGECRACRLIAKAQHPDFSITQGEDGRALRVDQIRELQRTLSLAPYEATYKIALLLRFEEANPNASNALLKTLEEPPPQVIMLLTASDAEALLPTILSRCEVIRLRPLGIEQLTEGLQAHWGLPAEEATLYAHLSGGRPGYALRLSQNPEMLEQRQNHLDELQQLLSAPRVKRFSYAEEHAKDRVLLQNTLQTWITFWRDMMLRTSGSSAPLINIDRQDEVNALAGKIDLATAKKIVNQLEYSVEQIERYVNPRLVTEVLMLDLPRLH
jgi:DNA polymerase-3 subunit delta'